MCQIKSPPQSDDWPDDTNGGGDGEDGDEADGDEAEDTDDNDSDSGRGANDNDSSNNDDAAYSAVKRLDSSWRSKPRSTDSNSPQPLRKALAGKTTAFLNARDCRKESCRASEAH